MIPERRASAPYPGRMSRWSASVWEALAVDPEERTGPRWFDVLIVVVLAVGVVLELTLGELPAPVLHAATSALAIGVLPWRRRHSLLAVALPFAVQFVIVGGYELADRGDLGEITFSQGVAGIMLVYALCRWATPPNVGLGLAVALGGILGEGVVLGDLLGSAADLIAWAIVAGFALAMRYRAALRRARIREARLAERNDLARDLHDSVAHHLSAIAVQAQAARYVSADDPAAAAQALELIEGTANRAIDEMRHMVGILRSDGAVNRSVLSTSLLDLADPDGSPRVVIDGDVDLSSISGPVAAAAYRITQEAITNARRHADGVTFVDVTCTVADHELALEIVNDGTPTTRRSGGGFGLVGMEERAAALSGSLTAGPHASTGWVVRARLPLVQS